MNNIIIIGGGASGLFAAINAANEDNSVTIIEANDKMGKKILSTGNGRCNFSNLDSLTGKYNCDDNEFIKKIFNAFSNKDIVNTFEKMGLFATNNNGYLYPASMQAASVSDMLISRCRLAGVKFINNTIVTDIHIAEDGGFVIETETDNINNNYHCDKVILAMGTKAGIKDDFCENMTEFLIEHNHTIEKYKPALCGMEVKKDKPPFKQFFKNTAGVRWKINASLYIDNDRITTESGELQFTNYGLSGIVIFQLAAMVSRALENNRKATVLIDFLPEYDINELVNAVCMQYAYEKKSVYDILMGILNSKLAMELINIYSYYVDNEVKPFNKNLPKDKLTDMFKFFKKVEFNINRTNDFTKAQVCCGGIDVDGINPYTMESKYIKNLYFTGEVINVDGKCGGYNLQWAWSTGYVAGKSCKLVSQSRI